MGTMTVVITAQNVTEAQRDNVLAAIKGLALPPGTQVTADYRSTAT